MITWIKFSERQPEKEGEYLIYNEGNYLYVEWDSGDFPCTPDYWAEINPPGVFKVSGITNPFNDPETIKRLQGLLQKKSPMPEKPLCKDCRLCVVEPDLLGRGGQYDFLSCSHPDGVSFVDGLPIYCGHVRGDNYRCGPEGRWFEAKGGGVAPGADGKDSQPPGS